MFANTARISLKKTRFHHVMKSVRNSLLRTYQNNSYSQSRIVQNTNKDKDTSSPVGTNSRVISGNLSSQKLTNRNEQIEVVEKKFDPNYKSNDPTPKTASERPNLRPRKISDYSELQPNFSDLLPSPPRTVEASSANKLFKNSYKQTPSRPPAAKTRVLGHIFWNLIIFSSQPLT